MTTLTPSAAPVPEQPTDHPRVVRGLQMALGAQYGSDTMKQTHQSHINARHPGRRPGIQCAPMPFANARSEQWIPDQVWEDKSESIKSKAQKQP